MDHQSAFTDIAHCQLPDVLAIIRKRFHFLRSYRFHFQIADMSFRMHMQKFSNLTSIRIAENIDIFHDKSIDDAI